jgi:hypothetical protein
MSLHVMSFLIHFTSNHLTELMHHETCEQLQSHIDSVLIMSSYYQSQKRPNFRNRQQDNNVGWMRLCCRNLGQQLLITKWVYSIV